MNVGVRFDRYNGWLPEQEQLGADGRAGLGARRRPSPRPTCSPGTQFAPRIGVVFDLTGDGRTVIKGNYGLFWHNPGVGVGSDANPNTATKSATYGWNDAQWRPALAAG